MSEQIRSPYLIKGRKIAVHGVRTEKNTGNGFDGWNLVEDGETLNKVPFTEFPTKGAATRFVKAA